MYESEKPCDVTSVRFRQPRMASVSLPAAIQADTAALFLLTCIFWGIVLYLALSQAA
jgi:hypothetical protein